jgi:DNA-directed RNA polymerase subunit M/transcription elongation factor TFIIS
MDNKVRQCLMYINSNYKNKLLNAFIKQDIEDLENSGIEFTSPEQFYKLNPKFSEIYNQYIINSDNTLIKQDKSNQHIVCPNCKSTDVTIQYSQLLFGDEVETEIISCKYCGGNFTNM